MRVLCADCRAARAIALVVETASGERFFVRFSDKGHVMTGWSLASAELFQDLERECAELTATKDRLDRAAKRYRAVSVVLQS